MIIKNVVHSLKLGVSPGSKLCATFLNIAKYLKTVRCSCGCGYFFNLLKTGTVTESNLIQDRNGVVRSRYLAGTYISLEFWSAATFRLCAVVKYHTFVGLCGDLVGRLGKDELLSQPTVDKVELYVRRLPSRLKEYEYKPSFKKCCLGLLSH